jgi:hypothetical protein
VTPRRFAQPGSGPAQLWLSFGSGLLTLFMRRAAVKTISLKIVNF